MTITQDPTNPDSYIPNWIVTDTLTTERRIEVTTPPPDRGLIIRLVEINGSLLEVQVGPQRQVIASVHGGTCVSRRPNWATLTVDTSNPQFLTMSAAAAAALSAMAAEPGTNATSRRLAARARRLHEEITRRRGEALDRSARAGDPV